MTIKLSKSQIGLCFYDANRFNTPEEATAKDSLFCTKRVLKLPTSAGLILDTCAVVETVFETLGVETNGYDMGYYVDGEWQSLAEHI